MKQKMPTVQISAKLRDVVMVPICSPSYPCRCSVRLSAPVSGTLGDVPAKTADSSVQTSPVGGPASSPPPIDRQSPLLFATGLSQPWKPADAGEKPTLKENDYPTWHTQPTCSPSLHGCSRLASHLSGERRPLFPSREGATGFHEFPQESRCGRWDPRTPAQRCLSSPRRHRPRSGPDLAPPTGNDQDADAGSHPS